MKKFLPYIIATLMPICSLWSSQFPSTANTPVPIQVIDYIDSQKNLTFQQKERGKALAKTLQRIQAENWWDNKDVFSSISSELTKTLSCFNHVADGNPDAELLIDTLEMFFTDTKAKKQLYAFFNKEDMKKEHTQLPIEECY